MKYKLNKKVISNFMYMFIGWLRNAWQLISWKTIKKRIEWIRVSQKYSIIYKWLFYIGLVFLSLDAGHGLPVHLNKLRDSLIVPSADSITALQNQLITCLTWVINSSFSLSISHFWITLKTMIQKIFTTNIWCAYASATTAVYLKQKKNIYFFITFICCVVRDHQDDQSHHHIFTYIHLYNETFLWFRNIIFSKRQWKTIITL